MAKPKNKKLGQMVVLLVLLAALIVGYVIYSKQSKENSEKEEQVEAIELFCMEEGSIEDIDIMNPNDNIHLVKVDGEWHFDSNKDITVNEISIGNLEATLKHMEAIRLVEKDVTDLSNYGLNEPEIVVTAKGKDNTTNTIKIGLKATTGDYYAMVNDDTSVYLVGQNVYSKLNYTKDKLVRVPNAVVINENFVTYLLLEDKELGTFEVEYHEKNPYDFTGTGTTHWSVNQGYPSVLAGDTAKLTEYFKNYNTIQYKLCVDFNSKDLSKYGLDDPKTKLKINFHNKVSADEKDTSSASLVPLDSEKDELNNIITYYYTYDLYIGDYDATNHIYYVKVKDDNNVYQMDADTVNGFLSYNKFDCIFKSIQMINVKSVSSVVLNLKGERDILETNLVKTTDEDGKEVEENQFILNGTEVDLESGRELYKTIISLKYDAELPEGAKIDKTKLVASFEFHRRGDYKDVTFSYYEYDPSFYAVSVDDDSYFLADKRDIDNTIKVLHDISAVTK